MTHQVFDCPEPVAEILFGRRHELQLAEPGLPGFEGHALAQRRTERECLGMLVDTLQRQPRLLAGGEQTLHLFVRNLAVGRHDREHVPQCTVRIEQIGFAVIGVMHHRE